MKLSVRDFEITMIPILMSLMEKDGNMVKNREFHHSNGKYKKSKMKILDKIKPGIINEELFWWNERRVARRDERLLK